MQAVEPPNDGTSPPGAGAGREPGGPHAGSGWIWQAAVVVVGITVAAVGWTLATSGVEGARVLVPAGFVVVAAALVARLLRRAPREPEPSSLGTERALATIAERSGLELDGIKIHGTLKGQRVEGELLSETGPLRITAVLERGLDVGLSVTRGKPHGDARPRVALDDPGFEAYWVLADQPERARSLLTPRLKELLLASGASLEDRGVSVTLPVTVESNVRTTLKTAARIVNELERASTRAPCAGALVEARVAWLCFAEQHALATADTPLSMWGEIEGVMVRARSVRDAFQNYHFEMSADFVAPLGRGLRLRPGSAATAHDRSDEPIGHPAFDKVFLLKATNPVDAARLIGPESREALLKLRDTGFQIRGNDAGLWAWAALNRGDPDVVPKGLRRMATLAKRIVENADRFPPSEPRPRTTGM